MATNFVETIALPVSGKAQVFFGQITVSPLFKSSLTTAAAIFNKYGIDTPGGATAWQDLIQTARAGAYIIPQAYKNTQNTLNSVLGWYSAAQKLGAALGVSQAYILALWAEHGELYLQGKPPASPSPKLLSEATSACDKYAAKMGLEAAYAQGAATANAATAAAAAQTKAIEDAQAANVAKAAPSTPVLATKIVKSSRGPEIAEFYSAGLEATFKVMASYGKRDVDTVLMTSLLNGQWKTIGDETVKATMLAGCLGTTPELVKSGWVEQRKLWAKIPTVKPTVPSPYFTGLGKFSTSAAKSTAVASLPPKSQQNDAVLPPQESALMAILPWLAIGAVGLGIVYFVSTMKPSPKPVAALANPYRRRRR